MAFNQIGFVKQDFNPQTAQGETNGLYASVTDNTVSGGTIQDMQSILDAVPSFVSGITSASNAIAGAAPQVGTDIAQTKQAIAAATGPGVFNQYTPTGNIIEQWQALGFWEKFATLLAIVVVARQIKLI